MKVVIQRSKEASVEVEGNIVGTIDSGLVILVGFREADTESDIDYLIDKVLHLRIFDDENGVMNKSILDVNKSILSISQFTLYANTNKGRRPSYVEAMKGEEAKKLYDIWNQRLSSFLKVETGTFGADMKVKLCNDGPVTIIMESR